MRPVILSIVLILFVSTAGFSQGYFYSFDSGEEDWKGVVPPATVSWEPALGNPPGSLRAQGAASPCIAAPDVGDWHIQADVFSDGANGCYLTVESYRFPDCTGSASGAFVDDQTVLNDQWVTLSFDFPLALVQPYFRIEVIRRSTMGTCLLDNVEAVGPLGPAGIPTLGEVGLVLLGLTLLGAGILMVRRSQA